MQKKHVENSDVLEVRATKMMADFLIADPDTEIRIHSGVRELDNEPAILVEVGTSAYPFTAEEVRLVGQTIKDQFWDNEEKRNFWGGFVDIIENAISACETLHPKKVLPETSTVH